ncbi:MFS transporter [Derxia gummosa]|uniref:MFS transporter n=1 Tax=Derxia gummosa DSM 723 TaxID=1121388 RepID=A0A9U5C488_9BURK|nr:MFS transporter [Derxia gummosa]
MTTESLRGRLALMGGHCAGMLDLVALPVWVGALVARYGFDAQQAGLLATLFLLGAVGGSLAIAPRIAALDARRVALGGFAAGALVFAAVSVCAGFAAMAALHALAGLCVGAALSAVHGTIARGDRPHRGFALAGMSLGVFAITFYAGAPALVAWAGGAALFRLFAVVMAVAALLAAIGFPRLAPVAPRAGTGRGATPIAPAVWFGVAGIGAMAVVQSMTFAFLERAGIDRGFGAEAVAGVLVALGFVNLFPAALAALLERRLAARRVLLAGPAVQAALAVVISAAPGFGAWAAAASVFAAVMLFTHTFVFGVLARLDPTGRALAATPAMLMTGAAIGPVLGGTLVKTLGYPSLGLTALAIGAVAVACFSRVRQAAAPSPSMEAPA